jgi:hypothetical protein
LNVKNGKLVWMRDLYHDLGGTRMGFGYSSHPLPYHDMLILAVGGRGKAVAAIDQKSGRTVWASGSFDNAHSSPIVINVDSRDQGHHRR